MIPNVFDKEKYVLLFENLQLYLRLVLKLKKIHRLIEFNHLQLLKPYVKFNTKKTIEPEKNCGKDGKSLYKLMNNATYNKTMENLRNRTDGRLVSNEKVYLKWTSKNAIYISNTKHVKRRYKKDDCLQHDIQQESGFNAYQKMKIKK